MPSARKPAPGYGNAVHFAMEKYFQYWNDVKSDSVPPLEVLIQYFEQGMEKYKSHFTQAEFDSHLYEGRIALQNHFDIHSANWNLARQHRVELKIKAEYEGIPITGIIDRLSQFDDHYEVYDYKTGKLDSGKFSKASEDDPDLGKNGAITGGRPFLSLIDRKTTRRQRTIWQCQFSIYECRKEDAKIKVVEVHADDLERVGRQISYVYQK